MAAGAREFALFSLAITTYMLMAQLVRSVVGTAVLLVHAGDGAPGAPGPREAAGAALVAGCGASVLLAAGAMLAPESSGLFWILVAATPLLLFQDVARHLAFARGRPRVAALSDGLWLLLQVAGTALVWAAGATSAAALLGVWAAAGALAGAWAAVRLGVWPRVNGAVAWVRMHRMLCRRLGIEFVLNSGSYYLLLYGLTLLAGVGELGRFRAAHTLIGPVIVVLLAGQALGVPESVRVRADPGALRRIARALSAALASGAALWGAATWSLLPAVGPLVFPSSWEGARPLLPALSLFAAALGVSMGAAGGLRALGQTGWILRYRGVSGGLALAVGLPLSALAGAQGALLGLAGSETVFAAASWWRLAGLTARRAHPLGVAADG